MEETSVQGNKYGSAMEETNTRGNSYVRASVETNVQRNNNGRAMEETNAGGDSYGRAMDEINIRVIYRRAMEETTENMTMPVTNEYEAIEELYARRKHRWLNKLFAYFGNR